MGGVAAGAAGRALVEVGGREERVQVGASRERADAEEGGEDDGLEGAAHRDAAGEVLGVLLGGALREDGVGAGGGGDDVRGEEGAGDGDVDGDDVGGKVQRRDDDVDLRPLGGAGGEAVAEVDLGAEERARGGGDETADGVVAAVAVSADAAREEMVEMAEEGAGEEGAGSGEGALGRVELATGRRAAMRRRRARAEGKVKADVTVMLAAEVRGNAIRSMRCHLAHPKEHEKLDKSY